MRRATSLVDPGVPAEAQGSVTMTFDERRKSRRPLRLDGGEEVELHLPRGTVLRHEDRLRLDDGRVVVVRAAPEPLSTVATADAFLLSRIAYHLGNRHVPLQIEPGCVRYQHDHVLDGMVAGLGVRPAVVNAPFQPEPGAYGGGHRHDHGEPAHSPGAQGHSHGDDHHSHDHPRDHEHPHTHGQRDHDHPHAHGQRDHDHPHAHGQRDHDHDHPHTHHQDHPHAHHQE